MEYDFEMRIYESEHMPVVAVTGDIDPFTSLQLKQAIITLINMGEFRVVINMAGVHYIDSSGLGTLIGALRRTSEQNGTIVISNALPRVQKVFEVTGLNRVLSVFDSNLDAVRSMQES